MSYPPENYPQVIEQGGLHPVEPRQHEKEIWSQQQYFDTQTTSEPEAKKATSGRIGGLKPWVFWLIIALISAIVVAASVGGAVGGARSTKHDQESSGLRSSTSENNSIATERSSASTAARPSTPTPTPFPLADRITTDCPSSNGTSHTPKLPSGNPGSSSFTKHCGSDTDGFNLAEAMVIDLDSCIDLCANWNIYWPQGPRCTTAVFNVKGSPPGNCWAKNGTTLKLGKAADSALLD